MKTQKSSRAAWLASKSIASQRSYSSRLTTLRTLTNLSKQSPKEYATTVVEQPEMMSYAAQLASLIEKVRRVSLVVVTTPRAHWTPSTINLLLPLPSQLLGSSVAANNTLVERRSLSESAVGSSICSSVLFYPCRAAAARLML